MSAEFHFRRKIFDGTQKELPKTEKKQAANHLKDGFQNLFTKHDDVVHKRSHDYDILSLELHAGAKNVYFSLDRPKLSPIQELYDLEMKRHELEVEIYDTSTKKSETFTYKLDKPDEVRREDKDIDPTKLPSPFNTLFDSADEAASELATSLGFNNQPVDTTEIKDILAEAEKAKPSPTNIFSVAQIHHEPSAQVSEAQEAAPLFSNYISDFMDKHSDRVVTTSEGKRLLEWESKDDDDHLYIVMRKDSDMNYQLLMERTGKFAVTVSFEIKQDKLMSMRTDKPALGDNEYSVGLVYPEYMKVIRRFISEHDIPPQTNK